MPDVYVERDDDGAIKGVYTAPQPGYAEEALPEDHSEVVAFLTPSPVPKIITIRQARRALYEAGLLDTVDAYVEGLSVPAQIDWSSSNEIERDHPLIEEARIALGMTNQEIDDLFILAASL